MFSYKLNTDFNYCLVCVNINGITHCASYNKSDCDGREVITSILSGEKFYSIDDFMRSHYGLRSYDILYDFIIYYDECEMWMPLLMFVVDDTE